MIEQEKISKFSSLVHEFLILEREKEKIQLSNLEIDNLIINFIFVNNKLEYIFDEVILKKINAEIERGIFLIWQDLK